MLSRATTFAVTTRAARYASQHGANLIRLQEQISSGIKLTKPSDNPLAFRQATSLQAQFVALSAADDIISDAETKLNISVSQLTEFNSLLASAQRLAQQGVQALDQEERNSLAIEAEGLLSRMEQIANSRFADQYLYGGARSNRPPYSFQSPVSPGGIRQTIYNGGDVGGQSVINPGYSVETLYPGREIFTAGDRQRTVVLGNTGAQAGSGTDTLIGRATLQVRHTATTYAAGSGVAPGTSSAGGDTVLGPLGRHQIVIRDTSGTGTAGTISLNNGPEIPFTNSDTDLLVTGPSGEKIFVNTTNITPGFQGPIDLAGAGTLSVDGGVNTTAVDFSGNQVVTEGASGRFVNIDSSAIAWTGDNSLEFPGTSDAFQSVYELIQDLRGTRPLSEKQLAEALGRRLDELDALGSRTLETVGLQSASLQGLRSIRQRNGDFRVEIETQLSNLQSTDLAEAVLRLQNTQTLQQFTYSVTAQIMSQSLINFLR